MRKCLLPRTLTRAGAVGASTALAFGVAVLGGPVPATAVAAEQSRPPAKVNHQGMPGDGIDQMVRRADVKSKYGYEELKRDVPGIQYISETGWDYDPQNKRGSARIIDPQFETDREGMWRFAARCGKESRCSFVGKLEQEKPVVAQSIPLTNGTQSPVTRSYTINTSEDRSRSETTGWTAGGSVNIGIMPKEGGANGSVTGNFSYSKQTTDTTSFGKSTSESAMYLVQPGNKGWIDVRANADRYIGWLVMNYPNSNNSYMIFPIKLDIKRAGAMAPVEWHAKEVRADPADVRNAQRSGGVARSTTRS
ncbi:hypothetical protein GCM10012275_48130 [Longimycelium tulufanense]|uniref:Uncharacterized protein n=1 Tax=Longimycelium tulufanense TaxID=907463 RepID=A0A8J3FYH1_9PSEU|nr:hypothetical protein [Longimycelium tulufanense]GGM71986.1 hypothetical protein GCM10012275_48130 [Longimycelium tulufanense]